MKHTKFYNLNNNLIIKIFFFIVNISKKYYLKEISINFIQI